MPNYKEDQVVGTVWMRCANIHINNPHASLGPPPIATFFEEEIIDMGNNKFVISPSKIKPVSAVVDPVNGVIDLYDPVTGSKIEGQTMTHAQLYAILYSAYRTEADKRDIALATPLPIENPAP